MAFYCKVQYFYCIYKETEAQKGIGDLSNVILAEGLVHRTWTIIWVFKYRVASI